MSLLRIGRYLLAAALLPALAAPVMAADNLTGVWVTDDGQGAIEFVACGAARCGNLIWLKDPLEKDGRPQRDVNNEDPALRERALCGAQIIKNLVQQPDGTWDTGTVYDPEEGKSYSVAVQVLANGNLQVTGYMGVKMLGETMIWSRAPANIGRCSARQDNGTAALPRR